MSEQEIAIIGSTEVIKPFLSLGINCYETQDSVAAQEILKQLEKEQRNGIIFISESLAENILPEIERLKLKELPAVFILPEYGSRKQLAIKRLEKTLARAIGKKL